MFLLSVETSNETNVICKPNLLSNRILIEIYVLAQKRKSTAAIAPKKKIYSRDCGNIYCYLFFVFIKIH